MTTFPDVLPRRYRTSARCAAPSAHSWARSVHQRIAGAIQDARRGRLTAQELADKTSKLGFPITRSQIANYESGRKQGLDVTELLVLAAALEVPALSLLFPTRPRRLELFPDHPATRLDAVRRFVGDYGAWPHREVAALVEQLDQISAAMAGSGELASSAAPVRVN